MTIKTILIGKPILLTRTFIGTVISRLRTFNGQSLTGERYWVGGTDNWDGTAGTKWAYTSGGSGGAPAPTPLDNVFFDNNSGNGTVTVTTSVNARNVNFTGFTGTLAGSSAISYYGNWNWGSTLTQSHTGAVNARATTAGKTITSNGKSFGGVFSPNGLGGSWTLQDAFVSVGPLNLSQGTFIDAGFSVTASALSSTGNTVRGLTRSGTWSLTGTGTVWNTSNPTNFTFSDTGTTKFTNNSGSAKSFSGGGLVFNNFWNATLGAGIVTINDSNTFNNFRIDAGRTQRFTPATTTTIATLTATGTSGNVITIAPSTAANYNIVSSGGATITTDYISISRCQFSGATWNAGVNSTNGGNNSGITF